MKAGKIIGSIFRWAGRILLLVLALLFGVIVFLFVKELITRAQIRAEYPAPGKMVSIGTHSLHLYCLGSGSPTVIFEADLDQFGSLSFSEVHDGLKGQMRTCAYDRAGILWSQPGPRPRDGETIAAELMTLLDAVGEDGPYILVAHGFGGVYTRILAGEYPDEVAGMVLVEASHPEQFTRFAELGVVNEIPDAGIRPVIWMLSHLGSPGRFKGPRYSMPEDVYMAQQAYLPVSSMAWYDESVSAPDTLEQAGRIDDLGDIPLIVLASAKPSSALSAERSQELVDAWIALQTELAGLSTNGELRIFEDAGHYLHDENPDAVIRAVLDVVETVKSR